MTESLTRVSVVAIKSLKRIISRFIDYNHLYPNSMHIPVLRTALLARNNTVVPHSHAYRMINNDTYNTRRRRLHITDRHWPRDQKQIGVGV
jgi:hypothetical protein